MKHIPAPWTLEDCEDSDSQLVMSPHNVCVCSVADEASANLIAAAPDMLEALKLALDLCYNGAISFKKYGFTSDNDIDETYRAAIAKAEGRI